MGERLALAAIQALLGRLSYEVQLQRSVKTDVQFINDEMESVKGFLLNLASTRDGSRGDHQVRPWIEQIMELSYISQNCMEDYAQSCRMSPRYGRGLIRHIKWLVRRLILRRRTATRIRKLKVRAREISERQKRYRVVVPRSPNTTTGGVVTEDWNLRAAGGRREQGNQQPSTLPAKDSPRWALLSGPDMFTEAKEELLRSLAIKTEDDHTRPWPSILAVVTLDGVHGASLAEQVCMHCKHSSSADLKFDYVVCITIRRPPFLLEILLDMLHQLHPDEDYFESIGNGVETWDLAQFTVKLKESLRGKRLLLVLSDMDFPDLWDYIKESLEKMECSVGSAVVIFTKNKQLVAKLSPSESKIYSLVNFYFNKVVSLLPIKFDPKDNLHLHNLIRIILRRCTPDVYCMNLLLYALLSNHHRTVQEFESLSRNLAPNKCSTNIERQTRMIKFCYDGLNKDYQNCLWYSTVFTRGTFMVRRASLFRKWVAEGFITRYTEAERCFDVLITQKLLLPREVGSIGKIKSCGVNPLFASMITDVATEEAFLDTNQLPADLQLHFSIRKGIQLRRMLESNFRSVESIISHKKKKEKKSKPKMKIMMSFLKHLSSSSSFRLLRVLELEGFEGFKKCHLKNISKIYQLKYLSLRNTDVTQLPNEIEKLEQLETLDIRGTKVQELNVVLPMLKHLLAGHSDYKLGQGDTVKSNELFTTLRLPKDVSKMEDLEILSHVKVYNSRKDLRNVGEVVLMKLRKMGVVLCGKRANLNDFFHVINERSRCLVSLSIRVEPPVNRNMANGAPLTLTRIEVLHQLVKITLRDTNLKEDTLPILGSLRGLQCLRLRYHSFLEAALYFREGQFAKLIELVIEDDNLRRLRFDNGTAPKLSMVVWSFTSMDSITGIKNLVSLHHLALNGGRCDSTGLQQLQQDISEHCNHVRLSLNVNPLENNQGVRASSSGTAVDSTSQ